MDAKELRLEIIDELERQYPKEVDFKTIYELKYNREELNLINDICRHIVEDGLAEKGEHTIGSYTHVFLSASHSLYDIVLKHESYREYLIYEIKNNKHNARKIKYFWATVIFTMLGSSTFLFLLELILGQKVLCPK